MEYIAKKQELESVLKSMKIPAHRKRINGRKSISWLNKNLKVENENNENYSKAIKIIQELL